MEDCKYVSTAMSNLETYSQNTFVRLVWLFHVEVISNKPLSRLGFQQNVFDCVLEENGLNNLLYFLQVSFSNGLILHVLVETIWNTNSSLNSYLKSRVLNFAFSLIRSLTKIFAGNLLCKKTLLSILIKLLNHIYWIRWFQSFSWSYEDMIGYFSGC